MAYHHDGGRCCHNTVLHGSHHHGAAWLAYNLGGSLSSSLGSSDGLDLGVGAVVGRVRRAVVELGQGAKRRSI